MLPKNNNNIDYFDIKLNCEVEYDYVDYNNETNLDGNFCDELLNNIKSEQTIWDNLQPEKNSVTKKLVDNGFTVEDAVMRAFLGLIGLVYIVNKL